MVAIEDPPLPNNRIMPCQYVSKILAILAIILCDAALKIGIVHSGVSPMDMGWCIPRSSGLTRTTCDQLIFSTFRRL